MKGWVSRALPLGQKERGRKGSREGAKGEGDMRLEIMEMSRKGFELTMDYTDGDAAWSGGSWLLRANELS